MVWIAKKSQASKLTIYFIQILSPSEVFAETDVEGKQNYINVGQQQHNLQFEGKEISNMYIETIGPLVQIVEGKPNLVFCDQVKFLLNQMWRESKIVSKW